MPYTHGGARAARDLLVVEIGGLADAHRFAGDEGEWVSSKLSVGARTIAHQQTSLNQGEGDCPARATIDAACKQVTRRNKARRILIMVR